MTAKLNPLPVCFGISILFHLVVVSVIVVGGLGSRPPALSQPEPVITLMLIAAPEEVALTPAKPVIPTPSPTPTKLELVKILEPVTPVAELIEPAASEVAKQTPVVPVVKPSPQETISGDGSSPKPGLDLTTIAPQPLVKAQPDYLKNPEPPYPPTALRRHQEGLVLLAVKVTAQGHVLNVEIKRSSGFAVLDETALQAVRDWVFEPARIGLLAVDSKIEVPVRFQITD